MSFFHPLRARQCQVCGYKWFAEDYGWSPQPGPLKGVGIGGAGANIGFARSRSKHEAFKFCQRCGAKAKTVAKKGFVPTAAEGVTGLASGLAGLGDIASGLEDIASRTRATSASHIASSATRQSTAPSSALSIADQLRQLAAIRNEGIISDAEYVARTRRIVGLEGPS